MSDRQLISWRRALLWSAAMVYGPSDGVLIYALKFVPCSHCKAAALQMLPLGPGVLLGQTLLWSVGLRGLSDGVLLVLGGVISAILVVGLAWLSKRGWWWLISSCLLAGSTCLFLAIVTLGLIRM
ncbi:MAG: hypothetical protein HZA46_09715 [Planctomycetales bacterium]|nr:hypothetical protein [Planctomycetales bacterium]